LALSAQRHDKRITVTEALARSPARAKKLLAHLTALVDDPSAAVRLEYAAYAGSA